MLFKQNIGPLLDRIDIHIEVTPVPFEKLSEERKGEGSVAIRKRVTEVRYIQTYPIYLTK
jgi:magnesium chelatase family protein